MKYLRLLLEANYSAIMVYNIIFSQSYFLYKSAHGKISLSAKQWMQSIFSMVSSFNIMVTLLKRGCF